MDHARNLDVKAEPVALQRWAQKSKDLIEQLVQCVKALEFYMHEAGVKEGNDPHYTKEDHDALAALTAGRAALANRPHGTTGEAVHLPFAILEEEMTALRRFDETTRDDESYDVPKEMMQRLAEIGLLRRKSGNYYEHTTFGLSVINGDFATPPQVEPAGCAHCQNPLYAGTKCKSCGRVTEPAPSTARTMVAEMDMNDRCLAAIDAESSGEAPSTAAEREEVAAELMELVDLHAHARDVVERAAAILKSTAPPTASRKASNSEEAHA